MSSMATHRARIIIAAPAHAAPAGHAAHAPATPHAQLNRQAALFRRLREADPGAQAEDSDEAQTRETDEAHETHGTHGTQEQAPHCEGEMICALEPWHRESQHGEQQNGNGGNGGNDGSSGDSSHDQQNHSNDDSAPWQYAIPTLAALPAFAAPKPAREVTPVTAAAKTGDAIDRIVETLVAEVADFCEHATLSPGGACEITIPLDPALLPGCTLSLALSHFQLTLRFTTADERSRQLISQHQTTLRASLEQVMQQRFDGTRSVEIIVS